MFTNPEKKRTCLSMLLGAGFIRLFQTKMFRTYEDPKMHVSNWSIGIRFGLQVNWKLLEPAKDFRDLFVHKTANHVELSS